MASIYRRRDAAAHSSESIWTEHRVFAEFAKYIRTDCGVLVDKPAQRDATILQGVKKICKRCYPFKRQPQ